MVIAAALVLAGCGGNASTGSTSSRPSGATPAPQSSATSLQAQYVAVVKATQPQVVQIQTDSGLGSGVTFDSEGHIVTNAHVVQGASTMRVTLADGRRFPARLVGSYAPDDLAVITVGAGHGIKPARFADSSKLQVGEIVLAVGNPLGLQSSVTDGIISALGREVSEGQGVVLPNTIQTSAAINPGNSGGALIDLQARVVGIPTLAAADPQLGSAAAGIGFAIPSKHRNQHRRADRAPRPRRELPPRSDRSHHRRQRFQTGRLGGHCSAGRTRRQGRNCRGRFDRQDRRHRDLRRNRPGDRPSRTPTWRQDHHLNHRAWRKHSHHQRDACSASWQLGPSLRRMPTRRRRR